MTITEPMVVRVLRELLLRRWNMHAAQRTASAMVRWKYTNAEGKAAIRRMNREPGRGRDLRAMLRPHGKGRRIVD
jgi:hypothetical protein